MTLASLLKPPPLPGIDFFDPRFKADPHPAYARLRAQAPVHRIVGRDGRPLWLVTRHADTLRALKDPRLMKNRLSFFDESERAAMPPLPPAMRLLCAHMLAQDPPHHTRLRRRVMQAFSPRGVESLRPRVQAIADALLDAVLLDPTRAPGHIELIDDYAFPLPITVIAELLGVPLQDRERLRDWSGVLVTHAGLVDAAALAQVVPALEGLAAYLGELIASKRRAPQDDLTSRLVAPAEQADGDAGHGELGDDELDDDELVAMLLILIIAGHETTTHLIGNGVHELLRQPAQWQWLADDPARLPGAIDELLRHAGPVDTSTLRYASCDMQLGDAALRRGDIVLLVLSSANRDAAQHADADRLDVQRAPAPHLAFGHGIHYCLGAALARLEAEIAFGSLMRRTRGLRLAVPAERLRWRLGPLMRGLEALPLRFDAALAAAVGGQPLRQAPAMRGSCPMQRALA